MKFFVEGPGTEKTCRMLDSFDDRGAAMQVSYGFYNGDRFSMIYATTDGTIAEHPQDEGMGHGFDPILIPDGADKPFGAMDEEEYRQDHPRGRAVKKLREFLLEDKR